METMDTSESWWDSLMDFATNNAVAFWVIVAAVALALIIIIALIVGAKRKKSKMVSFGGEDSEEPKQLTQEQKSGNYQATGGFNFAPGGAGEKQTAAKPEPEFKQEPIASESADAADEESIRNAEAAESAEQEASAQPEAEESAAEDSVDGRVEATSPAAPEVETTPEEAPETEAEPEVEPEPEPEAVPQPEPKPQDDIAPATGRLSKLRGRLSKSQNAIGQGVLGLLTAGDLDEDAWEEIEDTLIMADLGTNATMKVTDLLREKISERGVSSEAEARAMLREALIEVGKPEMDRSIKAMPHDGKPAVAMIVGVNGTGKTTTTGKLGRVLVAMGHDVVFGAADTFRAAAADQLETWGRRVGATTVRGAEGADPASVAFDAVATGVNEGVDVVLVDTAGRLHTSNNLMDQLGKVKRVIEKKAEVDEVLLVIDSTVGQNGLAQARIFREVVDITGVVLTKLDGTAKGGIVFQVQEELGVPVKLVGLGEGADDLAPFEIESFVDALLGNER
ncbi:signal recognition particle-docking protein FtsY [Corynebacterium pseudodiphtheriticum]